jgi:hypothetical protein
MEGTIIAGRFDEKERADALLDRLSQAGFPEHRYTSFFVNPPGQHDRTAIGGDRDESPGATRADNSALKGAGVGGAIGLGVGLAAAPLAGPAAVAGGLGVGAYGGSLAGALMGMGDREPGEAQAPARKSGFLVAVQVDTPEDERSAIRLLQSSGAAETERAHGRWEGGKWVDFDPTRAPALVSQAA